MSYAVHINKIETILKEKGFGWDDYLFLLNNQTIYKTLERLKGNELSCERDGKVIYILYNKKNILKTMFLEQKQIDFLIENKLIDEKEWIITQPNKYWDLKFNNKTLRYFSKLQHLVSDIWNYNTLSWTFKEYDEENYLDFFKTNLKNIDIHYTNLLFGSISVKKYEIIK